MSQGNSVYVPLATAWTWYLVQTHPAQDLSTGGMNNSLGHPPEINMISESSKQGGCQRSPAGRREGYARQSPHGLARVGHETDDERTGSRVRRASGELCEDLRRR